MSDDSDRKLAQIRRMIAQIRTKTIAITVVPK